MSKRILLFVYGCASYVIFLATFIYAVGFILFVYGCASYVIFLATFIYAVGFIGNLGTPTSLDGPAQGPLWRALAVDLGLLALFAVQHSVMARPWFKKRWTRIVPQPVERSTYVLLSSVALGLL